MSSPSRFRFWRNALVVGVVVTCAVAGGLYSSLPSRAEKSTGDGSARDKTSIARAANPSGLQLGVYDPHGDFGNAPRVEIEHIFMPWEDVDLDSLKDAAGYALARNRALLVTLEPWSWSPASPVTPTELRDGILAGEHDDQIRSLCGALGAVGDPVTVRWGHEMDLKNGRYPWSDWRPSDYVAAYRRFVDLCRAEAPNLAFMWSPRGEFDLGLYYPGDDYVDVIGLSIFGFQTYDVVANGGERDLMALLEPSYDRAAKFDKPIYISEFGCSGDRAYVERCNDFSAATLKRFPKLEGVVYYSAVEPGEWPAVYGKPDWRVRPGTGLLSEAK